MILRIDRLADVVQQRRQQKLLIVRQLVAGQIVHLQTVIQRVALGMPLGALLHALQRQQQHLVNLKRIDAAFFFEQFLIEIDIGILALHQLL